MADPVEATLRSELAAALAAADGVLCVYLYGSQAKGRAHRESDVDVGVLLDRALFSSREQRFEQRLRLTGVVSRALRRNDVDLVILNDAPPPLAARAAAEGRLVYCRDPAAELRFRRDAMLRDADLQPFLRRMERLALAALRK